VRHVGNAKTSGSGRSGLGVVAPDLRAREDGRPLWEIGGFRSGAARLVNVVALRTSVAYRVRTDGLIDRFISAEHAG
jgi:hypothetical protein